MAEYDPTVASLDFQDSSDLTRQNKVLQQNRELNTTKIQKVPKNWNIRKADLSNLSYSDLRYTHYGTKNILVPTEMLDQSNSDEDIAYFLGTGIAKRTGIYKNFNTDFLGLIKNINILAYSTTLKIVCHNCNRRFEPRTQQERLGKLDKTLQQEFVDSFFSDPKGDYEEGITSNVYLGRIASFLENKYNLAHGK